MEIWLHCSGQDTKTVSRQESFHVTTDAHPSVQDLISRFVGLYTAESPRWDDVADLATTFDWNETSNSTCIDHLNANGVSQLFAQEMVEASTRVNYGQVGLFFQSQKCLINYILQDVGKIHALGCMVCMASAGAFGVASGNFRIFENFLNNSDANVYLNTEVRHYYL